MRRPRNVQRVDHHHFRGWLVSLKRAGERYERYFRDQDSRTAALSRAVAWRDETAAKLPPPRKFKRSYSLNKTGVIGVHLARQRTRRGRLVRYYCATWIDAAGRPKKRSFSVAKYGKEKAFEMAERARRQALAELLQPQARRPLGKSRS